ncbi:MAG: 4-(cytidine 5'-diphospho)-2-C-methyl-D-erythritol kinase [Deltaproteobacteria bacterium]|nr:4-(cytidine 5'-diphospho)-2-C-methyl-D-erythritol kinase [Deltaproteobacteria bacterium]
MPAKLYLRAPAKVNLYLRILGRRPDGFHDIESLVVPVRLFDRIEVEKALRGVGFSCTGLPGVPPEENLAHRAAKAFIDAFGPGGGVRIRVKKTIPAGAGLGGGSSDAAAVLSGMDRLFPGLATPAALAELAASLGSDVPFFLGGRPAWIRGRGDMVEPLKRPLPPFRAVLVYPGFGVSTAWAYGAWDSQHPRLTAHWRSASNHRPVRVENDAIRGLRNDFEGVVFKTHPVLRGVKDALLAHGAYGALLSGSGSTVFGLFEGDRNTRESAASIARSNPEWNAFVVKGLCGA